MALPAVADVRRTWPDAQLAIAARPSIAPLFSLVAGVDRVVTLPAAGRARDVAAALADGSFDAAIFLPNSFQIALAARRAGIPERWGYRADWRGALLTRAVARPSGVHQAEYYQHLVRRLGCTNGPMRPELCASAAARAAGIELLRASGWNGTSPIVALAPGAAYGGAKRWPAESFASVATELSETDGATIVLVGAAVDARSADEVAQSSRAPIVNIVGKTDIPRLAGVLCAARGLITNDSGAMHFAAALGVPVTALFGPTREKETRPLASEGSIEPAVLTHDVWCRPCMLRECPLVHRCMRGITVDAVVAAARRSLSRTV